MAEKKPYKVHPAIKFSRIAQSGVTSCLVTKSKPIKHSSRSELDSQQSIDILFSGNVT
jgi:hypothetical protein